MIDKEHESLIQGRLKSITSKTEALTTFKSPVRTICLVFLACVVYLSAQAYFAFPEIADDSTKTHALVSDVTEDDFASDETAVGFIQYDHPPAPQIVSHTVVRGDTLGNILAAAGVANEDINRLITCKGECLKLHLLMPGSTLTMHLNDAARLLTIKKPLPNGQQLLFKFLGDEIDVSSTELERETVRTYRHVVIRRGESPISAALRAGGIKEATILSATQILEYDIDFWRNIHPNDEYELLYSRIFENGKHVADGEIQALKFVNQGTTYQAFLHTDGMHYEADGSAIQKQFLKAPLKYTRISSNFSNARKHPILGYTRAHRGTDYAAPRGTPVRVTAKGVIRARVKGDWAAGNYLVVDHSNGFQTKYLHLSAFAADIRKGLQVNKGRTIGYVGSTGLSTGPHLHYEVIKNGRHLNPISVPNPSVESLQGDALEEYLAHVDNMLETIDSLRRENLNTETIAVAP